jgi:hypothetical protein
MAIQITDDEFSVDGANVLIGYSIRTPKILAPSCHSRCESKGETDLIGASQTNRLAAIDKKRSCDQKKKHCTSHNGIHEQFQNMLPAIFLIAKGSGLLRTPELSAALYSALLL